MPFINTPCEVRWYRKQTPCYTEENGTVDQKFSLGDPILQQRWITTDVAGILAPTEAWIDAPMVEEV